MNRYMMGAMLLSALPFAATAQELPLYIDHGGELTFSGTLLDDAELNDMFGSRGIVNFFGMPEMIVKNAQTGAPHPVYTSAEGEGSDLRDDLEFAENEESDTREDLNFTTDEALNSDPVFDGPKDFFSSAVTELIHPQHGTWTAQLTTIDISGCPPSIGEMVAAQIVRSGSSDVTFNHPGWIPANLNPDYATLHWGEGGINGYYAEPYRMEVEGSGMALSASIALAAKSETRINVWARVRMTLAPMLAQMAGGAKICSAIVTGKYTKN